MRISDWSSDVCSSDLRRRHVADLVEEEGALVGQLDLADGGLDGPGEGPLLMAEELALQQVFRDGRAVDRDEGTLGARAELVQRAGEQLLSSSAFADDEDRDVGRRSEARPVGKGCVSTCRSRW